MSVEYATARLQFGRPIGSFQGVKHRCADMHVAVEQSRSTAYHAAWTLDDPSLDDPRIAVDLATVETAADYQAVAKNTVQVHGGIGFTWEHPVHLYYKRAVSDASLLGGRAAASNGWPRWSSTPPSFKEHHDSRDSKRRGGPRRGRRRRPRHHDRPSQGTQRRQRERRARHRGGHRAARLHPALQVGVITAPAAPSVREWTSRRSCGASTPWSRDASPGSSSVRRANR